MSRIAQTFARLKAEGRRALIPFIMAGDPDTGATRKLILELARAGADVIELGVPFSDPIADGPVIQRASMRALETNVGVAEALEIVSETREATGVPVVLFSYFNPLYQFGVERLAREASRAGVDGVLVTDLIPEAAREFSAAMSAHELDSIRLAAPTSTDARLRLIADGASGFIYAVARAGVTGARSDLSAGAGQLVARLRNVTELPIAVGFGISDRAQVTEVWRYADGAVVGSAIVAEIEKYRAAPDLIARIGAFTRRLKGASVE